SVCETGSYAPSTSELSLTQHDSHPSRRPQAMGDLWGFSLGDVCGTGPEAAALTALARYSIRAVAVPESSLRPR
ncbi:MAG: hypothetical protein ACYDEN_01395, partial [Acidimicrobiales bacterium]